MNRIQQRYLSWFSDSMKPYAVIGLATALAACSATPVPNYYTLTPTISPLANAGVKVIEVLPVSVPDRLDRSQIVLQDASGQSTVLDSERWSSTLSAELRDGLSSGLQQRLGAVDRYSSGMAGGGVSYRIAMDFSRFDIVQPEQQTANNQDALEVKVVVAWIVKRIDPALVVVTNTKANTAKVVLDSNRQLSCRMTFSTPIDGIGKPKIPNIVASSRQSLTRVINAVSTSVTGLEKGIIQSDNGVVCA